MATKILCVAEKNSVAKAVAGHLSGGSFQTRDTRNKYIKNYTFHYRFAPPWSECEVVMTAVSGHTESLDFGDRYHSWQGCDPSELFDAPTQRFVEDDKKSIVDNIKEQARRAKGLFIWTDCDREGEYIGTEVRGFARQGNARIEVKRAKFSNIERQHIIRAAQHPVDLDENQAAAVAARMELDLRIGAAFTRFQSFKLKALFKLSQKEVISYGTCQFPTLGFVVDRFERVKNFVPESFWSIKVNYKREGINVTFSWDRNRLFDRLAVVLLYENCLESQEAVVSNVNRKPTRKWKPLPLTTVELQKQGSRFLGMNSQRVMKAAEALYQSGFISYPRTETDQFDSAIDLRALIGKQTDPGDTWHWSQYARGLLDGGFNSPRKGRNNDKAHPPIHPVAYATRTALGDSDKQKVYEFVVRRFLACCSEDAIGETTTVKITMGQEGFHTSGLVVLQRNYLNIYVYDKWQSSQNLPNFQQGEKFVPNEAKIMEGTTSPPHYLTEPELIALMDANGIGTDATMAEHINKIQERKYVTASAGPGSSLSAQSSAETSERGGRGRGRGRGGRGGRGGADAGDAHGRSGAGASGGNNVFLPTNLGFALVKAYDAIASEMSLSKPFLRQEMEIKMKSICDGVMVKEDVVHQSLEQYREVYARVSQQADLLTQAIHTGTWRWVTDY